MMFTASAGKLNRKVAKVMLGSEAVSQIEELFSFEEQVCLAVKEAKTFQDECGEVGRRAKQLSQMLYKLLCFISSAEVPLYWRPINCILSALNDKFQLALAIVSKCKRRSLIGRLFTGRNAIANQFHELFNLLDASITDMEWLVTVYDPQNEAIGPMTNKNCAKLFIWSCIATAQMGRKLEDRLNAAKYLALFAQYQDEYKEIIFEEGGVPPLQKLLKDSFSDLDAQITIANALCLLANEEKRKKVIMDDVKSTNVNRLPRTWRMRDQIQAADLVANEEKRKKVIMDDMISTIVNRLSRKWPMRDQIQAADLVAKLAEHTPGVKEYDLIREDVIWRLVTLLSSEQSTGDPREHAKTRELKISSSKALLTLACGSVPNCRTLTETKGMLCLSKMVETEKGELQNNCLKILKEITYLAELHQEFRHSAFKSTTSGAPKAVVDQLLRVIEEFDDTELRIPAIKSIGSLSRSFSAKHSKRVISPLVSQLGKTNKEVALEAAISLEKFVCPENFLSLEHSKSIVQFNGIPLLMNLLEGDDKQSQLHGFTLIRYIAKHKENTDALILAGALIALETTGRKVAAEHIELKEMLPEVIKLLQSNHHHVDDGHEESYSSPESSIKQIIIEKSKAAFDSLRCVSSVLFEGLTALAPKLVEFQVKLPSTQIRCEQRLLSTVSSLRKRRIFRLLNVICVDLALGYVIDHPVGRLLLQVAINLWLMNNFVKRPAKKLIRKKFGYIVHKVFKNVICKSW